ncbi:MAG: hypothetical protein ACERKD_10845 [Prolixibacteraceae bacterium]
MPSGMYLVTVRNSKGNTQQKILIGK